jgi:hypothetical protein
MLEFGLKHGDATEIESDLLVLKYAQARHGLDRAVARNLIRRRLCTDEVGYAWGRGVPVIFLAQEGQEIHFDVRTHKCIRYRSILHLSRELEGLLKRL